MGPGGRQVWLSILASPSNRFLLGNSYISQVSSSELLCRKPGGSFRGKEECRVASQEDAPWLAGGSAVSTLRAVFYFRRRDRVHFAATVKRGWTRPRRASCDADAQCFFLGGKRRRAGGAAVGAGYRRSRSSLFPVMGLLELCEQVFGTADLYQVLGVRREASEGEVRRGYHKVSLQVHPDRVDEDQKEDATRRFQVRVWARVRAATPTPPALAETPTPGTAHC